MASEVTTTPVTPAFIQTDLIQNADTLYRMDGAGERFYYRIKDGEPIFYGSVTSIKKQTGPTPQPIIDKMMEMGREFDAYRNAKANFGTFWHIQAAELTITGSYDFTLLEERIKAFAQANHGCGDTSGWFDQTWKGLLSWAKTIQDFNIRPLAVEIPLWHPEGYAGTIDLVVEKNELKYSDATPESKRKRTLAIIDWKTGNIFPDHAVQLELNRRCWQFHYPHLPVQQLFNWTWTDWRKEPGYELRTQHDSTLVAATPIMIALWQQTGLRAPYERRFLTADKFHVNDDLSLLWAKKDAATQVLEKHGLPVHTS